MSKPFGVIYSYPGNFRVQRAQTAAALNGLSVPLADGFQMGVTNKTKEFTDKFAMGKVPAFEKTEPAEEAIFLSEGAAITTFVASSGPLASQLLGSDPKTSAKIAQWSSFADQEFTAHGLRIAGMTKYKFAPFDQAAFDAGVANTERALAALNKSLEGKTYLVGDKITLADIMCYGPLHFSSSFLLDQEMIAKYPEVKKWMEALSALPQVQENFGKLEFIEKKISA